MTFHYCFSHYIPLPKLHPVDQSRVMVTQFLNGKLDDFSLVIYLRYSFMVSFLPTTFLRKLDFEKLFKNFETVFMDL